MCAPATIDHARDDLTAFVVLDRASIVAVANVSAQGVILTSFFGTRDISAGQRFNLWP